MHLLFIDNQFLNLMIQAFCRMLLHSVWQGFLFAIPGGLAIYFTKKQSALLRYNIITFLFFGFLFTTLGTFIFELISLSRFNIHYGTGAAGLTGAFNIFDTYALQQLLITVSNYCSLHALTIVTIWFIFFLLKLASITRGLSQVQRIKKSGLSISDISWKDRISFLGAALGIRKKVLLVESAIVKIPIVIGYLKPMILLPIGLLNNLPAEQVEAVLLHELAHIRRNDYLTNLLQNIAGTVFFFNPAFLWLSMLMTEERENCCDDIALDITKNKKQFLQALVSFKEHASGLTSYTIAFPGRKNLLLHRFKRIITNENKSLVTAEKIFLAMSLLFCLVFFTALSGKPTVAKSGDLIYVEGQIKKPEATPVLQQSITNNISATVSGRSANERKRIGHLSKSKAIVDLKLAEAKKLQEQRTFSEMNLVHLDEADQHESSAVAELSIGSSKITLIQHNQVILEKHDDLGMQKQLDADRKKSEQDRLLAEIQTKKALLDQSMSFKDQQHAFEDQQKAVIMKKKAEKDASEARLNQVKSQAIE